MSGKRLPFRENEPQAVDRRLREEVIEATAVLRAELAPRLSQLDLGSGTVTLQNLVGSLRLPGGDILEVTPKVPTNADWTTAIIHLLNRETRIAVSGSRRSESSPRPSDLTAALAVEYARRLESAVRGDGPLEMYEHEQILNRRLNGRLNVGAWARSAVIDPTIFPIERDILSGDNDFTRGLSIVAGMLSRTASGGQLPSRLRRLQSDVIPGHALPTYVNPSVVRRRPPAQWRRYLPAWDIASALLRNRSVLGDPGRSTGLEVAIEPWPLLETLLERVLQAAADDPDNAIRFVPKGKHRLLHQNGKTARSVEPDGVLADTDGNVIATFEAKYTAPTEHPHRSHVYQALATAAALHSPTAVIVYPGDQPEKQYDIVGFQGRPERLITMGLSLFTYRRGEGERPRADRILQAILTPAT